MFENCTQLVQLSLSNFTTAQAIYLEAMFKNCINLRSLDLSSFDMSNVPYVDDMFTHCDSLNHLVLGAKTILNVRMNLLEFLLMIRTVNRRLHKLRKLKPKIGLLSLWNNTRICSNILIEAASNY